MLSIIIITKNESTHIEACLRSVAWADEIIVLDSGSTDDTVKKCQTFTPHVFETDWPGFGIQKQRALDKATGEWVFSIDADEIVSPALKQEIAATINKPQYAAYNVPRLSSYCGKTMRHAGWWPDYTPRLFKRSCGRFSDLQVHERIIIEGNIGKLDNPLLHEAFTDLEEVLHKVNNYSSLGAEIKLQAGKKTTLTQAICRGLWTFFRTYILKAAFLDGAHGLMLSISNAEGAYYKYAKLYLSQQNNK